MFKRLIRGFIFIIMGLYVSGVLINAIDYGEDFSKNYLLLALALIMLYFFLKPLLVVVGMPTKGIGYLFLNFVLTFIIIYALTLFLPGFSIVPTTLRELNIFGYVLPSKSLTGLWPGVFSALIISAVYSFMEGLCSKR